MTATVETCHCGRPCHVYDDLDGFTRNMCEACSSVRCDLGGGCPQAEDCDAPRWSAESAAAGHKFRATALVPGWCVRCGCARFVHGGAS